MRKLTKFATSREMGEWYDNKYKEMGGAWFTPSEACNQYLDAIEKYIGNNPELRLLDVGCGGGHFIEQAEKRFVCTGIELSGEGINESVARCINGKTRIFQEDIEGTNFSSGVFDIITSIGSLEHCINIPKAIKEIERLLASGGIFYILAPNETYDYQDQPNEVTMSSDEWIELLKNFKLLEVRVEGQNNVYILRKV